MATSKSERGRRGGLSAARRATNLYPLRKVVGYVPHPEYPAVTLEELECGHTQHIKQDMVGETNAERRRCGKCPRRPAPATSARGGLRGERDGSDDAARD